MSEAGGRGNKENTTQATQTTLRVHLAVPKAAGTAASMEVALLSEALELDFAAATAAETAAAAAVDADAAAAAVDKLASLSTAEKKRPRTTRQATETQPVLFAADAYTLSLHDALPIYRKSVV